MINENLIYRGAVLNLIGITNYVIDTIKGKTQLNRVTWFLWALASMVAFGAIAGGGVSITASLITCMVGFGPLLVLLASCINIKSVWKITRFTLGVRIMHIMKRTL